MTTAPKKRTYRTGAQHVGRLVPELMEKSRERFGFAYGETLTQWRAIVGDELAQMTRPERIRWPRQQSGNARAGGTLVIRVDGPAAIEVQHSTPVIIERINTFYGYDAISGIKIIQGRVTGRERRHRAVSGPLAPDREKALAEQTSDVCDEDLQDALQRLGRHILFAKS